MFHTGSLSDWGKTFSKVVFTWDLHPEGVAAAAAKAPLSENRSQSGQMRRLPQRPLDFFWGANWEWERWMEIDRDRGLLRRSWQAKEDLLQLKWTNYERRPQRRICHSWQVRSRWRRRPSPRCSTLICRSAAAETVESSQRRRRFRSCRQLDSTGWSKKEKGKKETKRSRSEWNKRLGVVGGSVNGSRNQKEETLSLVRSLPTTAPLYLPRSNKREASFQVGK